MEPIGHDWTGDEELYPDGGESAESAESSNDDLQRREEEPQGLLYFTRYDSIPIMVDALFDSPTSREFNRRELADKAGLSPRSVGDRIDILHELGVIEQVEGTDRLTLNLNGAITWKLRELDGLIKRAQGSGSPPLRSEDSVDAEEQRSNEIVHPEEDPSTRVMDDVKEQVTSGERYAD